MSTRRKASLLAAAGAVPALLVGIAASPASAHGAHRDPIDQSWYCTDFAGGSIWNPSTISDPACRAAVDASTNLTAMGTWQQRSHGDVAGKHHSRIPDGKLRSANVKGFEGLDLPRDDWHTTDLSAIQRDGGEYEFIWEATATHTGHIAYYITKDGVDTSKPLNWSDMEETPFLVNYTHSGRDASTGMSGDYKATAKLPEGKKGKHGILAIWQRALPQGNDPSPNNSLEKEIFGNNDSNETFYSFLDIDLGDGDEVEAPGPQIMKPEADSTQPSKVKFEGDADYEGGVRSVRLTDKASGEAVFEDIKVREDDGHWWISNSKLPSLSKGEHTVVATGLTEDGKAYGSSEVTFTVDGGPQIMKPEADSTQPSKVKFEGDADYEGGVRSVRLTDKASGEAVFEDIKVREDDGHWWISNSKLPSLSKGEHTVVATGLTEDGKAYGSSEVTFTVKP